MTLDASGSTETGETGPVSRTDLDGAAWGACQIRLVADRVPSRRTGSTHKVYRDWRIAVAMDHGHPSRGTTLFTIPIDPEQMAASQARYALVQLANQGTIPSGGASAFSWTTTSIGTADLFGAGLEEASRHLEADGWTRDGTVPTCYAKPDPTLDGGGAAAIPAEVGHLLVAKTSRPEGAALDGWETDGGTCA